MASALASRIEGTSTGRIVALSRLMYFVHEFVYATEDIELVDECIFPLRRFALLEDNNSDESDQDVAVSLHDTVEAASTFAATRRKEWFARKLVDLDTGAVFGVQIANSKVEFIAHE